MMTCYGCERFRVVAFGLNDMCLCEPTVRVFLPWVCLCELMHVSWVCVCLPVCRLDVGLSACVTVGCVDVCPCDVWLGWVWVCLPV